MIYLDTSALAKLIVDEVESDALAAWLDERAGDVLCTSSIARVELLRAARRRSAETVPAALALLAEIALSPLDAPVLEIAALLEPATLRSLDAVHLASATTLGSGTTFVAYDGRLLATARGVGLQTAAPGAAEPTCLRGAP